MTGIDTNTPHSARLWNYWLDGTDNYPADRAAGDAIAAILPSIVALAREDRRFLGRMVRHLVQDRGIRQILDIGSGLPTADNTHQVAQRIDPSVRVVYVDNDPLVVVQAETLAAGMAHFVEADLEEPAVILERAAETLDLTEPVAINLLGILHFVRDDDQARAVVRQLVDAVPAGSCLAIAHGCHDINTDEAHRIVAFWNERGTPQIKYRSAAEIARFFDGLELLEPGVVPCNRWRSETDTDVNQYCGVAVKP